MSSINGKFTIKLSSPPRSKFEFYYVEVGGSREGYGACPTKVACLDKDDPDTVSVQVIPLPTSIFQTVPSEHHFKIFKNSK